jgi:hypothetical protein
MQSAIGFGGKVGARKISAKGPGLIWKARNFRNVWGGMWRHALARTLKMNHMLGSLHVRLIKADGSVVNYGRVSTNLVTTAFVNDMVDELIAETTGWGDYKYHDSGVGTTAAAIGDTDIETTDGESRVAGTQVEGAANIYESVATISYTTTKAITEHVLANESTGGTVMDRHVFSAINVANGDSIQFTYDLTCTAGG